MTEQENLNAETTEDPMDTAAAEIPARDAEDHLPYKPTWKIALSGVFYAAFSLLLIAAIISALMTAEGSIAGLGWFIIVIFGLGALAGGYSSVDEFLHLKGAMALDKHGKVESVTILDDWKDHYVDGGIITRKEIYHIIYKYADEQEYAKHSIRRPMAVAVKTGRKIKVQYLPDNPKVFRPIIGE